MQHPGTSFFTPVIFKRYILLPFYRRLYSSGDYYTEILKIQENVSPIFKVNHSSVEASKLHKYLQGDIYTPKCTHTFREMKF